MLLSKSGKVQNLFPPTPIPPHSKENKTIKRFCCKSKGCYHKKKNLCYCVWLWMLTRHCGDHLQYIQILSHLKLIQC